MDFLCTLALPLVIISNTTQTRLMSGLFKGSLPGVNTKRIYGTDLVAYLQGVPCPNCGNKRKMELQAAYARTGMLFAYGRRYHCLSLQCPVCHHGNSCSEDREPGEVEREGENGSVSMPSLTIDPGATAAHFRQLSWLGKKRYLRMVKQLRLLNLQQALHEGLSH